MSENNFSQVWESTDFENVVDILDTFRSPVNNTTRQKLISGIKESELFPYYGATGQVGLIDRYLIDGEYVLLGEDGAPFLDSFARKAYIINGKSWVNNHAHVLKSKTNNRFLCYFLNQINYRNYVSGTTRLKLTQAAMKSIRIPVVPVLEQASIVAKLDELFSELDKGVEALQKAKEQLKVYRQAVLKDAFMGRYFEKNHQKKISTQCLENIVENIRIGPFGTMLHERDYIIDGIPSINPKHIKDQSIQPDNRVTISRLKAKELQSYLLMENDIILGRRGEMGRCAPVTAKNAGWICGTGSMILRLKSEYSAKFYSMILSSQDVVHFLEVNCTGTTMKNLNEKIVKKIPLPIFTKNEQLYLLNEIESRLSVCDKIEQIVDESLNQSESLKQSILKKAFEGKLLKSGDE